MKAEAEWVQAVEKVKVAKTAAVWEAVRLPAPPAAAVARSAAVP